MTKTIGPRSSLNQKGQNTRKCDKRNKRAAIAHGMKNKSRPRHTSMAWSAQARHGMHKHMEDGIKLRSKHASM